MRYRQGYTPGPPSGDFVYVIQGRDAVKVGVTRDLQGRLATLQTGSPHPLSLVYHLPISGDAYAVEAEAHGMLSRFRLAGEWFAVPAEVAVAAVNGAAFRLGMQPAPHGVDDPWRGWQRRAVGLALVALACVATGRVIAPPIGIGLFGLVLTALLVDLFLRSRRVREWQ